MLTVEGARNSAADLDPPISREREHSPAMIAA
jgi:hypothetical protein